jgi:transposase InsO family protein
LKFVKDVRINQKRVYRLLKENHLLVEKNLRLRAKREHQPSKPRPAQPNQWWGVDMTKAMTAEGWAYVVVVNDWLTKKILGAFVGSRSRAGDWLEAINRAVCRQFPAGIGEAKNLGLNLMSDNGSHPTSVSFMRDVASLGIGQAFTSYSNPKGNADTERLMRTLKEELVWLREWSWVEELARAVAEFVEEFNQHYLHSALGYKTPNKFEEQWLADNQMTLSAAA